ncbi:hypothetical protein MJO29_009822 [Puccinia striiformis f. sp. tritici]|nr:hypothetical protein MJO29_009822 [Puccinia striiformis f. sp. tritici]
MHDSHSNPDSNISETTSATLVSNVVTNEKQQGDGSQSSNLRSPAQTAFTETVQDDNPGKKVKSFRIPGVSFGSDLASPKSFRRSSRCASPRHPTDTCQAHVSSETQEQLAILGYRQELHRSWDFWSLFALSFCNVSIMTGSFTSLLMSYQLWGPILMTVGVLFTSLFMIGVNAVFAEMASAFPVAGAMFICKDFIPSVHIGNHRVLLRSMFSQFLLPGTFKLARTIPWLRDWARLLSWVIGFFLLASHLMLQLEIGTEFTRILATAIYSSGVDWLPTPVQTKMISLAYISICGLTAITPFGRSPLAWKFIGVASLLLNLSACIVLRSTSNYKGTLKTLLSIAPGHYSFVSRGYSLLRGWALSSVVMGSEPAAHMAEEAKNPASNVPRAMFYNAVFCGFWQIFCNVFVTLAIAPLSPPHRFIEGQSSVIGTLFLRCPPSAARFVTTTLLITSFMANTAQFLGTSRFFWALARDKALPFGKFWRQVTADRRPVRATCLMIALSTIVMFLSLEPTRWVERFASEGSSFLVLISYLTPCVLYLFCAKGVYNQDGRNVWNLKGFSKPLAVIAALFLTLLLAIYSGPVRYPLTINTFPVAPWAGLSATIISLVFWFAYGKSHFIGPIKSLSTWSVGFEIDLPKKLSRSVAPRAPTGTRSATTTRPGPQSVNHRSGAILTSQANDTLGIPQTYCTYGSDGSLWTESADQSNL